MKELDQITEGHHFLSQKMCGVIIQFSEDFDLNFYAYLLSHSGSQFDGLVVGFYEGPKLTGAAQKLDQLTNGELTKRLQLTKKSAKGLVPTHTHTPTT